MRAVRDRVIARLQDAGSGQLGVPVVDLGQRLHARRY
jgi:hypothetical protein